MGLPETTEAGLAVMVIVGATVALEPPVPVLLVFVFVFVFVVVLFVVPLAPTFTVTLEVFVSDELKFPAG